MSFLDNFKKRAESVRTKMERVESVFADREVSDARFEICKECPSLKSTGRCRECGCIMRLKSRLAGAECPLGKW